MKMQLQSFYGLCCILLQTIFKTALSGPVTENSIINSNSIFSSRFPVNLHNHQNHHHHQFGVDKPSKLRLYLLADLARAAETVSFCSHSIRFFGSQFFFKFAKNFCWVAWTFARFASLNRNFIFGYSFKKEIMRRKLLFRVAKRTIFVLAGRSSHD